MQPRSTPLFSIAAFLLAGVLLAGCGEKPPDGRRVACVGDSITYGDAITGREQNCYPAQLGRLLGEGWAVGNFGASGTTVLKKGAMPYWRRGAYKKARRFRPHFVIIMLGTNDTRPLSWNHRADLKKDYAALIESFQSLRSKPKVFLCSPTPAFSGFKGISNDSMRQVIDPLVAELAEEMNVGIIDVHGALKDRKDLFPDLIHPNAEGAGVIAATVHARLKDEG